MLATAGAGALALSGGSAKAAGTKLALSLKGWIMGGASLVLASGAAYYTVERIAPSTHDEQAVQSTNTAGVAAPKAAVTTTPAAVMGAVNVRGVANGANTANGVNTENAVSTENAVEPPAGPANAPGLSDAPSTAARPDGANTQVRSPLAPPASRPASSANKDTGFAEDAQLLRDVHAALAAGQPAHALALLNARNASGPPGVLAEEREAARIVTLCAMGRTTEARGPSSRFLAAHGSSPLAARVRKACQEADRGSASK
jgi:hypothetical protein